MRHSPPPASHGTQPWNSDSGPISRGEQGAVHAPPQSWALATCVRARRPGSPPGSAATTRPPGFTYQVQLLGGEAGRRLAQEQTEAIAAVLAWLAAHPPTGATGSAATAAIGRPVGQRPTMPTGTRPVPPSPAGAAGASTQTRTGGSGVRRHPSRTGQASPAGRAAWRVAGHVHRSDGGAGPGGGAGGSGPAGRGGRTGAGRAPGGGAPLGLASVAWVGERHGPDAVG